MPNPRENEKHDKEEDHTTPVKKNSSYFHVPDLLSIKEDADENENKWNDNQFSPASTTAEGIAELQATYVDIWASAVGPSQPPLAVLTKSASGSQPGSIEIAHPGGSPLVKTPTF